MHLLMFSISELAPVGGLIGLERGSSRGWRRDAGHDGGRGVRERGGKKCLICKSFDHFEAEQNIYRKDKQLANKSAQESKIILIFQNLV